MTVFRGNGGGVNAHFETEVLPQPQCDGGKTWPKQNLFAVPLPSPCIFFISASVFFTCEVEDPFPSSALRGVTHGGCHPSTGLPEQSCMGAHVGQACCADEQCAETDPFGSQVLQFCSS